MCLFAPCATETSNWVFPLPASPSTTTIFCLFPPTTATFLIPSSSKPTHQPESRGVISHIPSYKRGGRMGGKRNLVKFWRNLGKFNELWVRWLDCVATTNGLGTMNFFGGVS